MRAVLLAALLAAGCAKKSAEEQLLQSTDAAAGWVPALQMTAEKWVANSVPARFAASTARAAEKELASAQKEIARSPAAPELRRRLAADLRVAAHFAETMERAAGHDDPKSIAVMIPKLPPVHADLDSLRKQYGGGS